MRARMRPIGLAKSGGYTSLDTGVPVAAIAHPSLSRAARGGPSVRGPGAVPALTVLRRRTPGAGRCAGRCVGPRVNTPITRTLLEDMSELIPCTGMAVLTCAFSRADTGRLT